MADFIWVRGRVVVKFVNSSLRIGGIPAGQWCVFFRRFGFFDDPIGIYWERGQVISVRLLSRRKMCIGVCHVRFKASLYDGDFIPVSQDLLIDAFGSVADRDYHYILL